MGVMPHAGGQDQHQRSEQHREAGRSIKQGLLHKIREPIEEVHFTLQGGRHKVAEMGVLHLSHHCSIGMPTKKRQPTRDGSRSNHRRDENTGEEQTNETTSRRRPTIPKTIASRHYKTQTEALDTQADCCNASSNRNCS